MLSYADFKNATCLKADSFKSALRLCEKIRLQDPTGLYKIIISTSVSKGPFKFPFSNFCLEGEKEVIVTGDRYGNQRNPDQKDNTTWRTYTLGVSGENNIFVNLQIENTAADPKVKGTSVALALYGGENLFVNCRISSTQDTLFLGPLPEDLQERYLGFIPDDERYCQGTKRNYFLHSAISGSVDFIFGGGQGVFKSCQIESVEDGRMGVSYVTAPAQPLNDTFGFLFYDCSFVSSSIFCQRVYLGRPWRDYGKCCFLNCSYASHIKDEGFVDWSAAAERYKTARFLEFPLKDGRVSWMYNAHEKTIPEAYLEAIKKI